MTALVWDKTGEKFYQTGIQCGVLYLQDGRVAVWNGLTGMEETSESELSSYYLDGVKYLENLSPGDFSGQLKAWTYPDEFDSVNGIAEVAPGLEYYEQPPKSFNLSYQTRISNDIDSELGYKIHLLYNLLAKPDQSSFETLSEKAEAPTEFGWSLTGTPPAISTTPGYRPTVHVVVDSIKTDPETLQAIEDIIYGTATTDPRFPTIDELRSLFTIYGILVIIDNGDGTWTAIDQADDYITMNSPTQFTITNADATYLNATTYTVSTTYPV
jgi:hypothetical protein